MAKQTFTTGQVLTAAQMTSLQQTAMGGGAATAKTASYVLVAADAGTTVAMNAAGATTITVNTGLFAAGDTVFIQNLGVGACTVTAGSATVATAGSAILPQNDAGILYFTATGASIFYDFIQVGAASPLTTKGDLYTFSTSDTRIGVGADGTTLVADSSEATGLKWQAPAAGGTTVKIVSASASTAVASSTSTYVDTGLTVTITPTSATSQVLIISNPNFYNETSNFTKVQLVRGASTVNEILAFAASNGGSADVESSGSLVYLDSPATTSATTYKIQFARASGSFASRFSASGNGLSQIIAIEIGA